MSANPTLYEKLGGESGVESLISSFYGRVMADSHLAPFFSHSSIEKVKAMQKEFFAMALDGPAQYSGESLAQAHHGRGIHEQHLSRFVGHLLATLEDKGVNDDEAREVCDRINTYANEITGVSY